jgi:galactokinase
MASVVRVHAPGRVNLVGDHTDYTGGRALPMAIDAGITLEGRRGGSRVELSSTGESEPAAVALTIEDPRTASPPWARYVAGVVAELRPAVGLRGTVTSTLPAGVGLSSSAALEVAVALALGAGDTHDVLELARLCQRAEQRGSGVPCGLMDQLTCVAGVQGHALAIDFATSTWATVEMPTDLAVHVVPSGIERALATSAYAERRAACEAAMAQIGPLHLATGAEVGSLRDPTIRRRAQHVVSENARVDAVIDALRSHDLASAGALLVESHRSLRDDFEVSLPELDVLVERLCATPGVFGARLTGAGFGGCAVVFSEPEVDLGVFGAWRVRPSAGALTSRGLDGERVE